MRKRMGKKLLALALIASTLVTGMMFLNGENPEPELLTIGMTTKR